jgi:hypothetical protein
MIKSICVAALITTGFVASANAQTPKYVCDEAQITALESGASTMSDTTKRAAAMQSVTGMRRMLTAKDIAACELSINSHVKEYGASNR